MSIDLKINGSLEAGEVETYIHSVLDEEGALHFTLLDPEYDDPERLQRMVDAAEEAGTDAYMVGGSLGVVQSATAQLMQILKDTTDKPVIVFPGNVDGVTKQADAIFFMSLLNSRNPYWISGAQALGAPIVHAMDVEPLPMAYVIMEPGGTVSFIGDAKPIPQSKPDIAAAYALAGQYMGMRLVYLEAGSGAEEPTSLEVVGMVRKAIDVPLIVGGGIRSAEEAAERVAAGADVIVTGTLVEDDGYEELKAVVDAVKKEGAKS